MAQGIQKRISKKNVISYRVQIRDSDGFPPKSETFPTLQEAKDWQKQEKARRRQGLSLKSPRDVIGFCLQKNFRVYCKRQIKPSFFT